MTSIRPGEGPLLEFCSASSMSSSLEAFPSFGISSFHTNIFFCPVTIAKHSLSSRLADGLQASLFTGDLSLMIVHSRGRMHVYGNAGDDRTKRTRRRMVLLQAGDPVVATRKRPLGENDMWSTPRSLLPLVLLLFELRREALLRELGSEAVRWDIALDVEACIRSSKAAMPDSSCGLSGGGSLNVCCRRPSI